MQGYNLYAYCGNNPVCRIDISGTDSEKMEDADIADIEMDQFGGGGMGRFSSPDWRNLWKMLFQSFKDGVGGLTGELRNIPSSYMLPHEAACFVEGTIIHTATGAESIEHVEVGDYVWAWDEKSGEIALKEVVETYVNESRELIHVFVNGEEIVTTPTHPFYSPVKGWTDAVHLRAGDILVLVNGEYVVVEKIQHEILEAPITVYNFQVEDYHTYYVADVGVLVHNNCGMTNKDATAAAKELGYSKVAGVSSHGNAVYTNSKAPRALRFITADADVHSGGVWKAADSIANLASKATRSGTYDEFLRWIAP